MEQYSVLMTVYKKDNSDYFVQSVNSMLNQTILTNDFVLVCNGELTEELNHHINQYVNQNGGLFHVFRLPENVGLGKALKAGVPLCKNELIARMDDDDISHLDRCEKQLAYFKANPNVDILSSYVYEFEDDPTKATREKKVPLCHNDIVSYSKRRNPFNHSAIMLRKSALLSAGNYSEMRTNQDVDTWLRMLNSGCIGANIGESLVDFRFAKDTYRRRKTWNNTKLMIDVWKSFYKRQYCSLKDYLYVTMVQIAVFIMPTFVLRLLYDRAR